MRFFLMKCLNFNKISVDCITEGLVDWAKLLLDLLILGGQDQIGSCPMVAISVDFIALILCFQASFYG